MRVIKALASIAISCAIFTATAAPATAAPRTLTNETATPLCCAEPGPTLNPTPNVAPEWSGWVSCSQGVVSINFTDLDDQESKLAVHLRGYSHEGRVISIKALEHNSQNPGTFTYGGFATATSSSLGQIDYLEFEAIDPHGAHSAKILVDFVNGSRGFQCSFLGTAVPVP